MTPVTSEKHIIRAKKFLQSSEVTEMIQVNEMDAGELIAYWIAGDIQSIVLSPTVREVNITFEDEILDRPISGTSILPPSSDNFGATHDN